MTNYLAYGAIGLGLALAVLAYRLLAREQQHLGNPRKPLLSAIYVFMGFALVLATGGFVSEYLKSEASQIGTVKGDFVKTEAELKALQAKYDQLRESVSTSQAVMRSLMAIKGGKVDRLKNLNSKSPEYVPLISEIQKDLEQIDSQFRVALGQHRLGPP